MLALIMAGGSGTRFWPKSRRKHPKQLLRIIGERTLIQSTVDRLVPIISKDRIFIISTEEQRVQIQQQLPSLPPENYIVEPRGKNTAPCIGLSAMFMERIDPNGVMVVLPSDHLIVNNELFYKTLKAGAKIAAENDCLVTIGIPPNYPATGYGYIQCSAALDPMDGVQVFKVKTFAEKPNLETAQRFLDSGDFLWNSGIFIWRIPTILREIEEHLPHLYDGLMDVRAAIGTPQEAEVIKRVYCQIRSISIDYGVMEQAKDVVVLKGQFGWNDLGSWDEVYKLFEQDSAGNVLLGKHIIKDAAGCFVDAPNKCVALVGVNDLIVVETDDALLICPRDRAQDVKEVVEIAKRNGMEQYL
ncbi:MAG: mannose-1-phosphate guanylyltransferase [Calditrichaeota bacterium]|nr:MAG: mannose-1-phosphate guanylyltransferase [Calditrichota bacterium]